MISGAFQCAFDKRLLRHKQRLHRCVEHIAQKVVLNRKRFLRQAHFVYFISSRINSQ